MQRCKPNLSKQEKPTLTRSTMTQPYGHGVFKHPLNKIALHEDRVLPKKLHIKLFTPSHMLHTSRCQAPQVLRPRILAHDSSPPILGCPDLSNQNGHLQTVKVHRQRRSWKGHRSEKSEVGRCSRPAVFGNPRRAPCSHSSSRRRPLHQMTALPAALKTSHASAFCLLREAPRTPWDFLFDLCST